MSTGYCFQMGSKIEIIDIWDKIVKYLYFRTNRYNADRFDTFEDDNYECDDIDEFINDEEESDESEVCPFMKHKQHVCMYSGFFM